MSKDTGGPAFPYSALCPEEERGVVGSMYKDNEGMTLRDWFAGIVRVPESLTTDQIEAVIGRKVRGGHDVGLDAMEALAIIRYQYADAMLKERGKA